MIFDCNCFIKVLDGYLYQDLTDYLKSFVRSIFPNVSEKDMLYAYDRDGDGLCLILQIQENSKSIYIKGTKDLSKRFPSVEYFERKVFSICNDYQVLLAFRHYVYGGNSPFQKQPNKSELAVLFEDEIDLVKNYFQDKSLLYRFILEVFFEYREDELPDYIYIGNERYGVFYPMKLFVLNMVSYEDNYSHPYMRIGPISFQTVNRKKNQEIYNQKKNYKLLLKITNVIKFMQ